MAELINKATGVQVASIPDRELADIIFADVIVWANADFYESLEGELQLSKGLLEKALQNMDTDPLLDSLKRPTLEMLIVALGSEEQMDVHFKKEKI